MRKKTWIHIYIHSEICCRSAYRVEIQAPVTSKGCWTSTFWRRTPSESWEHVGSCRKLLPRSVHATTFTLGISASAHTRKHTHTHTRLITSPRWTKYCDQRVCLSVCPLAYIKTTQHFMKFSVHVTYDRGSVLLWWQRNTLCTSGFLNDVMFLDNGACTYSSWAAVVIDDRPATHPYSIVSRQKSAEKKIGRQTWKTDFSRPILSANNIGGILSVVCHPLKTVCVNYKYSFRLLKSCVNSVDVDIHIVMIILSLTANQPLVDIVSSCVEDTVVLILIFLLSTM